MKVIKRLFTVVLSIALVVTSINVINVTAKADASGYYRVEAEHMQINRARIKDVGENNDSNGKHVEVYWQTDTFESGDDISNNSYVRTVVEAPEEGDYTIKIGCTTWGDVSAKLYVNNRKNDVTLPAGTNQEYEITLHLNKGKNAIIFSWINWCEIDYFMFPDTLTQVKASTDTYYAASDAALNMTWFNTLGSIYDPEAELYTGTMYLNADENGVAGDEEWQPSATFTVDIPEEIKSMEMEYYIDTEGSEGSQISMIINGNAPIVVPLDNSGVATIKKDTLTTAGLELGKSNTIKVQQKAANGGSIGVYCLRAVTGNEPVSDDVTKTALDLVNDGSIRIVGRTLTVGTAQSMDWTNAGFQFVYEGSGDVKANITTWTPSKLYVEVNGELTSVVARKGTSNITLASGLAEGTYTIKVNKATEANGYLTQLNSISYNKNGKLTATAAADLKFEFVGDSITCGNQIDSETGAEDGYYAYAGVLARAYGADWNTISCSGRGLMQGYNSESGWAGSMDAQMKDVFDYVSYWRDNTVKYDYNYQPDVLVLSIGSNDLGVDIMNTCGTTIDDFCAEVQAFSRKVRVQYPDTKIIWCYGTYYNNEYKNEYAKAVSDLEDDNIVFVEFPQMLSGKDGHPNYAQHKRMAKILSEKISEMLNVTNPMPVDNHYEAEAGTITANGTNANLKTEENLTPYSGNAYAADMNSDVADAKDAAYVTVGVNVDKAGIYKVTVSYGSSAETSPSIAVKSNSYAWSSQSVVTAAGWDMIKTFDVEVYLKAGANTVSITGATNGSWANIDCFELEYLREGTEPEIVDKPENPTTNGQEETTNKPEETTKESEVITKRPVVKAPEKAKIKKAKNLKGKKVKVSLKKVKKAVGYQIQYSLNRKFKKAKKVLTKKLTYTIKKLKKKKTYHIRARAYVLNGKKKVYGAWSKVKKIKIKK